MTQSESPPVQKTSSLSIVHLLCSLGFICATFQIAIDFLGQRASAGYIISTLCFGLGLLLYLISFPHSRKPFVQELKAWGPLMAICLLLPLCWGFWFAGATAGIKASLKLLGLAISFMALRTLMAKHQPMKAIQTGALCVIFFNAGLWVLGCFISDLTPFLFEVYQEHDAIGALLRFKGLSPYPSSAGLNAMVALALLLPRRKETHVRAALGLGTILVVLTFSTFTLLLPLLILGVLLRPSFGKKSIIGLTVVGIVFLHWYQPLSISAFQHTVYQTKPHTNWLKDDLGPQYMPKRNWDAGPVSITAVPRVYRMVWTHAFSCLLQHPLGLGVDQFERKCPITTMNTLGVWSPMRGPHSQYNDGLTAYGFPGLLVFLLVFAWTLRKYGFSPPFPEWKVAVAVILMSGFYGPYVLTIAPFVFFPMSFKRR